MKELFIYALVHPDTDEVFYVGQTTTPKQRLQAHMSEYVRFRGGGDEYLKHPSGKTGDKRNWITHLRVHGKKAKMVLLDRSKSTNFKSEGYWIVEMLNDGQPLTNDPKEYNWIIRHRLGISYKNYPLAGHTNKGMTGPHLKGKFQDILDGNPIMPNETNQDIYSESSESITRRSPGAIYGEDICEILGIEEA